MFNIAYKYNGEIIERVRLKDLANAGFFMLDPDNDRPAQFGCRDVAEEYAERFRRDASGCFEVEVVEADDD